MKFLPLFILTGVLFAQDPGTLKKTPVVPDKDQTKLQALLVKQQKLELEQVGLVERYKTDANMVQQIKEQGLALEKEVLKELNLDEKLYSVEEADGTFSIKELPKQSEKPQSKQ